MDNPHLLLTIKEMCNTGSFASIYRADHSDGERKKQIALKIMKEQWLQDQEQIHRFWDEAQLLTKLNHPHIVKAQGICELQGLPAIIMDFIDGFDIKLLLQHPSFLFSPKMAFEVACTIAKTLDEVYYHSQNQLGEHLAVLHRDIKPSNVMINRHGLVQVLDFGASRFEDEERMGETNLYEPGTQKYSPPDRRLGERGNHKGDIFAAGLLLIEMLSNQLLPTPPLQQEEYRQFLHYHIEQLDFAMPNQQWTDSVKDTLYRMCAYDPNIRLNAKQAVHMLEPYAKRSQSPSLRQVIERLFPQIPREKKQGQWSGQTLSVQLLHSLYRNTPQIAPGQQTQSLVPTERLQEPIAPVSSAPKQPAAGTTSVMRSVFSHRVFWRNFVLSAGSIFFLLHVATWIVLSSRSEKSLASTEASTQLENPLSENALSLSIHKKDLAVIEIFDQEDTSQGKLTRSKSFQKFSLPKGRYSLSIKIFNRSDPHTDFSFSLKEEGTVECSLQQEKPFCLLNGEKL